jgi:cytochrome c553
MNVTSATLVTLGVAAALAGCMQPGSHKAVEQQPTAGSAGTERVATSPGAAALLRTTAARTNPPASPDAGAKIAANGAPNGVAACAGCHGAQGEGNAAAGFPRIAGQPQAYLAGQMEAFANGSRNNPVMSPIAKAMNKQQMQDASAYYALAEAPAVAAAPAAAATTAGNAPRALLERGRVLASVGDQGKRVQACANCHGPGGAGEAPSYPYLAGQHAPYLANALNAWKSNARNSDPTQQMPTIAKRLNDQDIAALAAFYAAQPAPTPAGRLVNVPAGSVARPAVQAGASSAGPSTGTTGLGGGTEQGAPTTGGVQGPGGGGSTTGTTPSGNR